MIEMKATPPRATASRAQEQGTQGGPVELRLDQLKHVAGGGFILSELVAPPAGETNGFILSE